MMFVELCVCLSLAPGNVNITGIRCNAVNLINWCDVEWKVSMYSCLG